MNMAVLMENRKENIYRSNRKADINRRLKQHRKAILRTIDQRLLAAIRKSQTDLDEETLLELIGYANSGEGDVIKQLGNIIIDNPQLASYIGERVSPFLNDSWWWLIRTLAVAGFVSQQLLGPLIDRMKEPKRNCSNYCLEHVTQTLAFLTEQPIFCSVVVSHPEALIGLAALMESPIEQIRRPAFRLFSNLLVNSYEEANQVIQLLGRNRLTSLMKLGLLSADIGIKLDCCMALTNLALNSFITEELIELIIVKSYNDKSKVRRELSYYLLAVANTAQFQLLGKFIEAGLVYSLKEFMFGENKSAWNNGFSIVQTLFRRLSEAGQSNSADLEKLIDLLKRQRIFDQIKEKLKINPALNTELTLMQILKHQLAEN